MSTEAIGAGGQDIGATLGTKYTAEASAKEMSIMLQTRLDGIHTS